MTDNPNYSEHDIIKGCLQQDRRMQALLYNRFSPKLYAVCLRYMGNEEDAQDVLQDAFIKVFRNIDKYRGEGSLEGWLRRIVVNTAIEHIRRKQLLVSGITEKEEQTIENKTASAFDKIGEKELLEMIRSLSPGYRTVFNLFVIEGFSHKEIAELLNINEGTSKSQLARAKMILQEKIKNHLQHE